MSWGKGKEEKAPYLKSANQSIVNLVLVHVGALVIDAGPSPHILVVVARPRVLVERSSDGPENHGDNEPADSKHRVVGGDLFRSPMSTAAVREEDDDTGNQRNTSHGQHKLLGPGVRVLGPRRHSTLRRQRLGGIEDGEGSGEHRQNDQTAAEVDTPQRELGHAHSRLDFLQVGETQVSKPARVQVSLPSVVMGVTYQVSLLFLVSPGFPLL